MRGVIMETKNGRAVLLTKSGSFVNIRNKGYSVGDKVNITSNASRLCAMAASLVVVCAGIGSYFIPTGYVSVDINPSLMITLNPYNRVIDVQTFNDDARVLLSKTDIRGKSAEESVEMLIDASEAIGYINDNNRDVILEVVPGIRKPNIDGIKHENIELTNEIADRETLRIAQNIGVSMAKVKAIEEYTEKNGGDMRSNAAKFNDKSVKEIRAIMRDDYLSDKQPPEMPLQNPIPEEPKNVQKPLKSQINGASDAKPPRNIQPNLFPVIEQETGKNIPDNQPPQNDYRPPENIPISMEHQAPEMPPVPNEQEFQPIHIEPKPQDKNLPYGGGKPEFSKPMKPIHKYNVPPVTQLPSEDEKPQDEMQDGGEQDGPEREDDNLEMSETNPDNETNQGKEDIDDTPQINPQPSEPKRGDEPKFDEPPQDNPQPNEPRHEEAPPHGESQNNGSNLPPNENMGGQNEHKEMP